MRIAVFNHPFSDFYTSMARLSAGLVAHLAGLILPPHQTLSVVVTGRKAVSMALPESLEYLHPWMTGDQSQYGFFSRYYRFGSVSNFDHRQLREFSPQCFFLTSFAYGYFDGFREQVTYIKRLYPKVPVICGGPGPSCDPPYYLKHSEVDGVVKGPAEPVLSALLSYLETGTADALPEEVVLRSPVGSPTKKPVVVSVRPFVTYQPRQRRVQLQVTRGCPRRCAYCSVSTNSPGEFQQIPIEQVLDALTPLSLPSDVHFNFEDDNLTLDRNYCLSLLGAIRTAYPQSTFSAENGIDVTTLDEDLVDALCRHGCTGLNLSLTSVSVDTLRRQGRRNYLDHFSSTLQYLAACSLSAIVYYICGLPGDRTDNILETLAFLMQRPVLIGISPYYPVPGTALAQKAPRVAPILSRGSSFHPCGLLTTAELVTFFLFTRAINFLKSTSDADWSDSDRETSAFMAFDDSDRRYDTRQIWRHSIRTRCLTGYRRQVGSVALLPYPLAMPLSDRLFDLVCGDTPLVNRSNETLNKGLWT